MRLEPAQPLHGHWSCLGMRLVFTFPTQIGVACYAGNDKQRS